MSVENVMGFLKINGAFTHSNVDVREACKQLTVAVYRHVGKTCYVGVSVAGGVIGGLLLQELLQSKTIWTKRCASPKRTSTKRPSNKLWGIHEVALAVAEPVRVQRTPAPIPTM